LEYDHTPENLCHSPAVGGCSANYNVHFDWSEFAVGAYQDVRIEIADKSGSLVTVLHPGKGVSEMERTTEKVTGSACYYRLLIGGQEVDSC